MLPILIKRPSESRPYDMDFKRVLRNGSTLASVTAVAFENLGKVEGSADITLGDTAYSGTRAQVWIDGGTDGEDYLVTMECATSNLGETVIDYGLLQVRDKPCAP